MNKTATSVQKMIKPPHLSLEEVSHVYFTWLPTLFGGLIKIRKDDELTSVAISLLSLDLLKLERDLRSREVAFQVIGGALASGGGEFIFSEEEDMLVTSLKNFSPKLPWPIYRVTQYPFHDLVMFLYSQHLLTLR